MDEGESLLQTLNREIREELGITSTFTEFPQPFFFSITPIENPGQSCKLHYDLWVLIETDGVDFKPDTGEFHSTKWMDIVEAIQFVPDNIPLAFEALNKLYASNQNS